MKGVSTHGPRVMSSAGSGVRKRKLTHVRGLPSQATRARSPLISKMVPTRPEVWLLAIRLTRDLISNLGFMRCLCICKTPAGCQLPKVYQTPLKPSIRKQRFLKPGPPNRRAGADPGAPTRTRTPAYQNPGTHRVLKIWDAPSSENGQGLHRNWPSTHPRSPARVGTPKTTHGALKMTNKKTTIISTKRIPPVRGAPKAAPAARNPLYSFFLFPRKDIRC